MFPLRSALVTTQNHLKYHCTNMTPNYRILEPKNEATKPTDMLEDKTKYKSCNTGTYDLREAKNIRQPRHQLVE